MIEIEESLKIDRKDNFQKVLLLENEQDLAEGFRSALEREKFIVHVVKTFEEALEEVRSFEIVLVDYNISGERSGLFLEKIYEFSNKYPVLFLMAGVSKDVLPRGADDYISSPFTTADLRFRVKKLLNRKKWYMERLSHQPVFSFSKFTIHFNSFNAETLRGRKMLLPIECYLMRYLVDNPIKTIKYRELLENIWGISDLSHKKRVDEVISKLRKYFEESKEKQRFFIACRGEGYKFMGRAAFTG